MPFCALTRLHQLCRTICFCSPPVGITVAMLIDKVANGKDDEKAHAAGVINNWAIRSEDKQGELGKEGAFPPVLDVMKNSPVIKGRSNATAAIASLLHSHKDNQKIFMHLRIGVAML